MPKVYEYYTCYRCGRKTIDWFTHYCPAYPIKYYRMMYMQGGRMTDDLTTDGDLIHNLIQSKTDVW